mmetsp:Transcript_4457/g.8104  ORF Transcript_4457/g.8104 Transcript_4457/m.8104 type:complete len:91 (-) Transcript_4457:25-297(-)
MRLCRLQHIVGVWTILVGAMLLGRTTADAQEPGTDENTVATESALLLEWKAALAGFSSGGEVASWRRDLPLCRWEGVVCAESGSTASLIV